MGPGKKFCCVTTRRRRSRILSGLGRGFGPLAARALGFGVACLGFGGLAMSGLPLRRQPTPDLALTLGVLAVALIPASRLIPVSAPFAVADPRTRSARSGHRAPLCLNVRSAHGRCHLPREKLGENAPTFSPSAIKTRTRTLARQSTAFRGNETKNKTAFEWRIGRRRQDRWLGAWRSPNAQDWR
jgi:hypothetical protein